MEVAERGLARLVVGAAPIATWFLVGDLSEEDGYLRIVEIPSLARPIELVIGLILAVATFAAAKRLGQRSRAWLIDDGHWRVYVRLLAAGMIAAVGGRIVTSATVGANIGGGGIMMVGPFVVLYLLERARQESRELARRDARD